MDLATFWPVLREGGALCGDDYDWDGVRLAVDKLAAEIGRKVRFVGAGADQDVAIPGAEKWLLRK